MQGAFKHVIVYCLVLAILGTALDGCGLIASTGLNENDEELVAEYAAGVLMRYSADKKGGLGNPLPAPKPVEEPELPVEEPETEPDPAPDAPRDIPDDNDTGQPQTETEDDKNASAIPVSESVNGAAICEAIGIYGFDMSYNGYETAEVYPASEGNDLTFSMQAAPGKELIVLHLDVINPGSEDAECDVLDCNVKFRILVNDSDRINEQMTILLNDLKSYKDTIGAGQKTDTVLVFEADTSVAESIGSLSLIVVGTSGESVFKLM
ncbi:MAG: hypothetical protein IKP31_07700 [Lachnospiraceae bacterium]|nr:hypothetical protein [Lachnospiraceae bacterium]